MAPWIVFIGNSLAGLTIAALLFARHRRLLAHAGAASDV
jgi:hypothetical protein